MIEQISWTFMNNKKKKQQKEEEEETFDWTHFMWLTS